MAEDGTMKMSEAEGGFEIAAGEELVLKPGGKHLMLMGFSPGDATDVDLRLDFDGTFVDVVAPIDFEQSAMMNGGSSGMHGDSSGDDAAALAGAEWVDGDLASILAAMDIARLHEIDDELAAGTLDADSQLPDAQRALAVARTAEWPIDVDPTPLIGELEGLEMALKMGSVTMAAMHAAAVHDLAHDLEPGHG
jgi:periplasmic copper chaperone A